jgi:hypothetical protein
LLGEEVESDGVLVRQPRERPGNRRGRGDQVAVEGGRHEAVLGWSRAHVVPLSARPVGGAASIEAKIPP